MAKKWHLCSDTAKSDFWMSDNKCHFWPWNRLPIEKRVAPACSAQNFTIGGPVHPQGELHARNSQKWLFQDWTLYGHGLTSTWGSEEFSVLYYWEKAVFGSFVPYFGHIRLDRWAKIFIFVQFLTKNRKKIHKNSKIRNFSQTSGKLQLFNFTFQCSLHFPGPNLS